MEELTTFPEGIQNDSFSEERCSEELCSGEGCREESKDEFWDALSSNYDYLMDDGLIATCREASSDLSLDDENEMPEACCWTFTRFIEQFKWLHDLLHNLQEAKEDDSSERSAKIYEERQKIAYLCKLFNEQAQKLCKRYPDMRDEVHRRLNLLNNKWKAVEQSINPNIVKSPAKDCMYDEITNRMCSLRRWLRELESRLCAVQSAAEWPLSVVEEKYKVQVTLQKEIEGKDKYVSVLLKLCEHLKGNVRFNQHSIIKWDAERVRKVAKNLEHRWHSIWLKSLECLCVLEEVLRSSKTTCEKLEKSFSEEPLKKYPRLSSNFETIARLENELRSKMNSEESFARERHPLLQKNELKNDKAVMVGATGIAELKADCSNGEKFEIVQDVGYSSETSAHLSTDEKQDERNSCAPEHESGSFGGSTTLYLPPDKYPSISLKTLQVFSDDRSVSTHANFTSVSNMDKFSPISIKALHLMCEDRAICSSKHSANVPNTFYKVACVDDDDDEQLVEQSSSKDDLNEDIVKKLPNTPKTHRPPERSKIKNSPEELPQLEGVNLKKSRRSSKVGSHLKSLQPNDPWKNKDRVCEWLNTCQSVEGGALDEDSKEGRGEWEAVNSSCDASGECTTTESDSEKSNTSDVNNSVTFSQSFTGSIETVIPAAPEEGSVAQAERTGCVRMRKKKRSTRERPWSVIELAAFSSHSVPHSTSESALDLLYTSSHEPRKTQLKSVKNKRLSLSDIASLDSPSSRLPLLSQKDQKSLSRWVSQKKEAAGASDGGKTVLCVLPTSEAETVTKSSDKFPDTSSLPETLDTGGATEDQASISDQAWDEYQDPPYLSEPYSEQTVDEDEVRKLISFGDDYRATLGSYSDASSISLRVSKHKTRTKSKLLEDVTLSSDSDSEDFHHILETSTRAYQFVSSGIREGASLSSEFAELIATCQTNLCHLNAIAAAGCELESVSKEDVARLKDLIRDWEELHTKVLVLNNKEAKGSLDLEAASIEVRSSLASLKEKLGSMAEHATGALDSALSLEQVHTNIQNLQTALSNLQDIKDSVLAVSARILRLTAEGGGHISLALLKENATKLYQQWEDVYELNCSQLTKLQNLQFKWSEPTEEQITDDLETTVQWHPVQVGSSLPKANVAREDLHPNTAAEVQVADRHDVLLEMETSKTSKRCILVENKSCLQEPLLRLNLPIQRLSPRKDAPNSQPSPKAGRSCFWRTLKAAMPIQLVLVLLYCLSCLMEPQCCESMNNYDFSILPQLRYLRGPPPV